MSTLFPSYAIVLASHCSSSSWLLPPRGNNSWFPCHCHHKFRGIHMTAEHPLVSVQSATVFLEFFSCHITVFKKQTQELLDSLLHYNLTISCLDLLEAESASIKSQETSSNPAWISGQNMMVCHCPPLGLASWSPIHVLTWAGSV